MSEATIQTSRSSTDTRILNLLGNGTPPAIVANATGVSESYISQLLSEDEFKNEVLNLKFENLSAHSERDLSYDKLEDKIASQLSRNLCLIQKPNELLRALQVVNGLKRRGVNSTDVTSVQNSQVVNLTIPTSVVQQFTLNINNQVINAGEQTLETMQSSTLLSKSRMRETSNVGNQNELPIRLTDQTGGNENEIFSPISTTRTQQAESITIIAENE